MTSYVDVWMSKLTSDDARRVYRNKWGLWMQWLRQQEGWADATEEKLLEYQENANGKGRYIILDLVQRYVKEKGGTRGR